MGRLITLRLRAYRNASPGSDGIREKGFRLRFFGGQCRVFREVSLLGGFFSDYGIMLLAAGRLEC